MATNKTIDIKQSLEFFFKLPDWKMRTLWIGGITALLIALYVIVMLFWFVPIIGWIIGCCLIFFLAVGYLVFWIGIIGYQYEIIRRVKQNKPIETLKFNLFKKEQFRHGLKLFLGDALYSIPALVLYSLTYGFMFLPVLFVGQTESNSTSASELLILPFMLISYLPMFLGWFYLMFQQFFIFPSIRVVYTRNEKFSDMFDFKHIWRFIKKNLVNFLLYFAIFFAIMMLMQFLFMLSFFLIFICIGILVTPILISISVTYFVHVQAHIIGQMAKVNKE